MCANNKPQFPVVNIKKTETSLLSMALDESLRTEMQGVEIESIQVDDACTWKTGIECTNNTVTALWFCRAVDHATTGLVALDSLPPTLQHLHLRQTYVSRVVPADMLPRELRYLCLLLCRVADFANYHKCNFARLPAQMEEFIVSSGLCKPAAGGKIHIQHLPQTMRLLYIYQGWRQTEEVLVNYGYLPGALENLCISSWSRRKIARKIRTSGSQQKVKLEVVPISWDFEAHSMYYGEYYMKSYMLEMRKS